MSKVKTKGQRKKIKGRIIRILDGSTVVINLGREHGVKFGNVFYILSEPEKVIDPLTNDELGSVAVNKATVKASQIFDKFTLATTSINYPDLVKLFEVEEQHKLPIDPKDIMPWKAASDTPIKVGDEVEVNVERETEE